MCVAARMQFTTLSTSARLDTRSSHNVGGQRRSMVDLSPLWQHSSSQICQRCW